MDKILLIGAGGHTRACIDVIEQEGTFKVAGLIENNVSQSEKALGYPVIGVDDDLKILRNKHQYALVTVGQIRTSNIRVNLFRILKSHNYTTPVIISPTAYVSKHTNISEGTIIMHGAIVNADTTIGANCIINSNALIEHGAIIGDHCHIATSVTVNGEVQIGEGTFLGSGVVTKHGITIGRNCVVSVGCVIRKNLPDNETILQ